MDTLELLSAVRALKERSDGEVLRGIRVHGGVAHLQLSHTPLLIAWQRPPLGLWLAPAPLSSQDLQPAGPAAILGQKLRGFGLAELDLPWGDRILQFTWTQENLARETQHWILMAECFGSHGALVLLNVQRQIHWASRWDSWGDTQDSAAPRLLPGALYLPPSPAVTLAEALDKPQHLLGPRARRAWSGDEGELAQQIHDRLAQPGAPWWRSEPDGMAYPIPDRPTAPGERVPVDVALCRPEPKIVPHHPSAPRDSARSQHLRLLRRHQRLQDDLRRWAELPDEAQQDAQALFSLPDHRHHGETVEAPDYRVDGVGVRRILVPQGKSLHQHARDLLKACQRAARGRERAAQELAQVEAQIQSLADQDDVPATPQQTASPPTLTPTAPIHRAVQAVAALPPGIERRIVEGFDILWGKTARANDMLTFRMAQPHDLWLHLQDVQGSHVVIRRPQRQKPVPETVLRAAAEIALQYSDSRALSAEVDWTEVRQVTRAPKGGPGRVLYRRFHTLRVRRPGSG